MLHVYEFEVFESEGWLLAFPYDLEGGTQGKTMREVAEMAANWLQGEMEHYEMAETRPPESTFGNKPEHGGENMIVAVSVDLDAIETLAASDAAKILGVSRPRVSQMLKTGQLEGYSKGRATFVTKASVEARLLEKPRPGRPRKAAPA